MFRRISFIANKKYARYLHDRKLPSVKLSKKINTELIGTQSPKKADHQSNKKIKEIIKDNKDKK